MPAPHEDTDTSNSKSSKKSRKSKKKGDEPSNPYLAAARTVARCIDLWCEVDKVVKIVRLLQQEENSERGELDEDNIAREVRQEYLKNISVESREFAMRAYYKIIQLVPGFKELVEDPSKATELAETCTKINADIKGTRSNDATHLKGCIHQYCLPNTADPTSFNGPPILKTNGRAEMGLNHPILARWLCPGDRIEDFDKNPTQ